MRVGPGLFLSALMVACATTPSSPGVEAVQVTAFDVRLDGPDDGALSAELSLPRPSAPFLELEWELFLQDFRVAAGVERVQEGQARSDGRVSLTVQTPLVFRGVPWRAGSTFLRARLIGVVRLRPPSVVEYRFSTAREVVVQGVPTLQQHPE
ncbi:MAG: hypothetical protein AB1938_28000 [Myxococcota bacterium]